MNYKFLSKNGVLIAFGVAVVAILITFIPILGGLEAYESLPDDVNVRAASEEGNIFSTGIMVSFILTVVAFGAAILLSIAGVFSNLKDSKKGLIAFLGLAVLFFIMYATASEEISPELAVTVNNPEYGVAGDMGIYKMISGGIAGTILLLIVSFVLMVAMEVWNFFKNA